MGWFTQQRDRAVKEWAKFNNGPFKNAAMAGCALAAAADGNIQAEEVLVTQTVINGLPELACFDPVDLCNLFGGWCTKVTGPLAVVGKMQAAQTIGAIKKDPAASACLVQIVLAVVNSDGVFDEKEKRVFREICGMVGVDPTPYL